MKSILLRRAALPDVAGIKDLLRDSFDPDLNPYMTYLQSGIDAFLSVPIQFPDASPDKVLLVATEREKESDILAFAEFRRTATTTGFLSYICVASEARGRGVASELVHTYLHQNADLTQLELDVFGDNVPAVSLYKKMGFQEVGAKQWMVRGIAGDVGALEFINLHSSLATYEVFGFCEFTIRRNGVELRVGRIGEHVIRCFSIDTFMDLDLHASLKAVFPQFRSVLYVAEGSERSLNNGVVLFKRSMRMQLKLNQSPISVVTAG